MKYQIWQRRTKIYNGVHNHKLIKTVKTEKEFQEEIKKMVNVEIGKSFLYTYAIGDIK